MFHKHKWRIMSWNPGIKVYDVMFKSHPIRVDTDFYLSCNTCGKTKTHAVKGVKMDAQAAATLAANKGWTIAGVESTATNPTTEKEAS